MGDRATALSGDRRSSRLLRYPKDHSNLALAGRTKGHHLRRQVDRNPDATPLGSRYHTDLPWALFHFLPTADHSSNLDRDFFYYPSAVQVLSATEIALGRAIAWGTVSSDWLEQALRNRCVAEQSARSLIR